MSIFKVSYKIVRKNSDVIYKGFGFKHHSDATQYYVHYNNQSINGTTSLCQPIGESVVLFSLLYMSAMNSDNSVMGDFYSNDDSSSVFFTINIPNDWRQNEVVPPEVFRYDALCIDNEITIAAYDDMGRWIESDMKHLSDLYKLLPCFCVLLARECQTNIDFSEMYSAFTQNPSADVFVNLHEDFYQAHKTDEYEITYSNLAGYNHDYMRSFRDSVKVISENKKLIEKHKNIDIPVVPFPKDQFLPEYHILIPSLPPEFVIPKPVIGICNAISGKDVLSVLFHGPAGTGKTMACKLICQEIGLPLLDVINCTENLDEFVLGKFLPAGDRIVFSESYVTRAIRFGGAVVFEEINFAKPQYLSFLNSLLDDNGFVRLDNGEVVLRHKNFRFFATMNPGYFGTKELNQALYNRFNVVLELSSLSDEAIVKMLTARVPECVDKLDKLLGVYHKLKKKIDTEEQDMVISPRNLENWARLAKHEGYLAAAEKTIIPIAKRDRVMEEAIRGILMMYKWEENIIKETESKSKNE